MKVLALHGRGSNNEIMQLQTAPLRARLDDYDFEFVSGTVLHTEGNWSLHTDAFAKLPRYTYYTAIVPDSILQAEANLLQLIEQEGPFDGVVGYSGGAALAAQVIIRDARVNPWKSIEERPFRFGIFINGASPLRVVPLCDEELKDGDVKISHIEQEAAAILLRTSATRKKGPAIPEDYDPTLIQQQLKSLETRETVNGRQVLTDGRNSLSRYDAELDGIVIDIPTLHVRDPGEETMHHGLNLVRLCDPSMLTEHHHQNGHDFPRGHDEMDKIASLIRQTAEYA